MGRGKGHMVKEIDARAIKITHSNPRDSSFGITTRYGLDGLGIESRWEARFSSPVQTGPGAQPSSYKMGAGGVNPRGCGVDHPPHLAPRLKKE